MCCVLQNCKQLVDLDCERFFKYVDSVSIHTRGHSKKLCNTAYNTGTYCHRIINIWNSLPDNVLASPSVCTFAKRLKSVDITKFAVLF